MDTIPLSPISNEEEVQNGITVLPVKSLESAKVSTSHAALPRQTGY